MATYDVDLGVINVGSVRRLRATLKKNNNSGTYTAWSGIDSVLLIFEAPDQETQFSRAMTLEDDASGIWYYDLNTTDVLTTGYWRVTLQVTDGGVVVKYPYNIEFYAASQP